MSQRAAFQIVKAMSVFDNEPEHIRQQAEQIIMQRVQLMRGGDQQVIDGAELVKEYVEPIVEPEPVEPLPEPEIQNPESDTSAA